MSKPRMRSRLSSTAVKQIERLIVESKLAPGSRLPGERELGERLGVGRSSVREALRVLEVKGLVEVKPGSGSYVKDPASDILQVPLRLWLTTHKETVQQIFELRALIEPGAAALAAQRIEAENLTALRQTLVEMEDCIESNDMVGVILTDAEFHHVITEATHNTYLVRFMNDIVHFLEESRKASLRVPGQAERALAGHRQIFQAVSNGDAEGAHAAMAEHLSDAWYYIALQLEQDEAM